jgi:anaerobic ribonucleoside-triphosphate reductase activating protein
MPESWGGLKRMACNLVLNPKYNVAAINRCTGAEGPYKRLAIWFQGCDKQCPGCCNPDYFSKESGHIMTLEELCLVIETSKKEFGIEGVTWLGGEPVLQAGLERLNGEVRKMDLGVILFTGRKYEELEPSLVSSVDLIVDGGFEKDNLEDKRNLVGSRNQKIYFVTKRYKNCEDWFYIPRPKQTEINVSDVLSINGDYLIGSGEP